ncbi:MAG: hypothetical protein AAF191_15665 [Verrucomicrobiota bacterium]
MACLCPNDEDSAGKRCGNRAAACRAGGDDALTGAQLSIVEACRSDCTSFSDGAQQRVSETKGERLERAEGIPDILGEIRRQAASGDPEAQAQLILATTGIRVGRRSNDNTGLVNLRVDEVAIEGRTARLRFTGKSDVDREIVVSDPQAVEILRRRTQGRGGDSEVFDDTSYQRIYRQTTRDFAITPHDFRRNVGLQAGRDGGVAAVSEALGNTRRVAARFYVKGRGIVQ